MRTVDRRLLKFARWVLKVYRNDSGDVDGASLPRWVLKEYRSELGDVDGASLQEKAVELGLLVQKTFNEPCGEYCECAAATAPPYECFVLCQGLKLSP